MTVRYRRVSASPGKHGSRDWRVEFNGDAPKHSEIIFMLGMVLIAEDRYPKLGRYMLMQFIDLVESARTPERVLEIATDCEASKEGGLVAV